MTRLGYDKKFSVGTIAGSSVLGMLIPPSILMIVYGSVAKVSIGKLFFGGIIPGLILSFMYCAMILIYGYIKPEMMGVKPIGENAKDAEPAWKVLTKPWSSIILILIIFGGMWAGYFTPTEAGGVGAFITLLLIIFKGNFTWRGFWNALLETGMTSGSILFLLISAQMFSRMLAISGVIE
jgi:tripartite ATP-independent transporter DctM subunit